MAKFTSAYSDFTERMQEVRIILRRARELERKSIRKHKPLENLDEMNALSRSAVVLLCSHLEGYIKDLGELTLDRIFDKKLDKKNISSRFFYYISKNYFDEIKDTNDPDKISEKVFVFLKEDGDFWNGNGPFNSRVPSNRFQHGFASPSIAKIGKFFSRFGFDNYKRHMQQNLKAQAQPTFNMIENLVSTRNDIAHGDLTAVRTPSDVTNMLDVTSLFCRTTDRVFGNWCKTNLCTIR